MMKNILKTVIVAASIAVSSSSAFSQASNEEAKKYISIWFNSQYDQETPQKAIQEKGEKVGIFMPYVALKFSTGISSYKQFLAGLLPSSAYAMLDIDTTVFQEITDEFYKRFGERMATTGIRIADYESVKNSSIYTELSAQPITDRFFRDVWLGESRIYTQQNAPIITLPNNPSVKLSKWMNSMKATPSVIRLVIDFMEYKPLITNGEQFTSKDVAGNSVVTVIKIASSDEKDHTLINFYEGSKTQLNSDKAKMQEISPGFQMGGYMKDILYFHNKSIYELYNKAELVDLKESNLPDWAVALNDKYNRQMNNDKLVRWAVKIDREEYKRAALAALDRYTDYIVTIVKSYQKK